MTFQVLDYVIFFASLVISAVIGLYYRFTGGKQKSNEEYLLGDRQQNPVWVAFSLMASFMSAVSILSGTSEAYVFGTHFFLTNIGHITGTIVSLAFIIPTFYKLKSVSVYKYLELRFGYATRICTSLAFMFQMLLYMGITLVAPAVSLQQIISDISSEMSIILCGLICVFYAFLGGMKAIIITDVFQSLLMFGAIISVIYAGCEQVGGFFQIWEIAENHQRIDFFNISLDPTVRHSWLSVFIGGLFTALVLNGINQTQVQRYLTMKNYKSVVMASLSSACIITILSLLICFSGLSIFAVYYKCDPIKSKKISKAEELLPYFVVNKFGGSGLSGLFVSGIFSASLSTISPLLNSLAAVTLEDYIKPFFANCTRIQMKTTNSFITQILTLFYGISCILLSLMALKITSLLQAAFTVFNVVGGPMLGVFILGMFTTVANQKGAIIGFVVGMASTSFLCLGQPRPKPQPLPTWTDGCDTLNDIGNHTSVNSIMSAVEYPYIYRISYMYYGLIGFTITFIFGYLLSILLKNETRKKIRPNLLCHIVAERLIQKRSSIIEMDDQKESM